MTSCTHLFTTQCQACVKSLAANKSPEAAKFRQKFFEYTPESAMDRNPDGGVKDWLYNLSSSGRSPADCGYVWNEKLRKWEHPPRVPRK